jgi:hypothetical protein
MPIYLDTDVHENPEILLECWSIRETASGDRYFVGFNTVECDGRVSTPIVSFDPRTRFGLTSSGRQYRLLGRAGFDKDGEYVWNRVTSIWETPSWSDITEQLCPDWRNPIPEAERAVNEFQNIEHPASAEKTVGD